MQARTAHEHPLDGADAPDAEAVRAAAPLHLDWIGAPGRHSCTLDELWNEPRQAEGVAGVFIIWIEQAMQPTTLYVGAGRDVGLMLAELKGNPRITAHAWTGALRVAWAAVASMHRPGVARYLVETLTPTIDEAVPAARTIPVNLPS